MSSAWRRLPPSDVDFGRVGQDARRASQRQEMKRKPLRPATTKVLEASRDRLRTGNRYTGEKEYEQQREPADERTEYYVHSRVTPVFSERGAEIAVFAKQPARCGNHALFAVGLFWHVAHHT